MVSKSLKSTIKTGKLENLKSENYPSYSLILGYVSVNSITSYIQ